MGGLVSGLSGDIASIGDLVSAKLAAMASIGGRVTGGVNLSSSSSIASMNPLSLLSDTTYLLCCNMPHEPTAFTHVVSDNHQIARVLLCARILSPLLIYCC